MEQPPPETTKAPPTQPSTRPKGSSARPTGLPEKVLLGKAGPANLPMGQRLRPMPRLT